MFKRFHVEDFDGPGFNARLRAATQPDGGYRRPLATVLEMLKRPPLPCQTAIFEEDYVDQDYRDEFGAFYSQAFRKYSHRCTRVHFFSAKVPLEAVENIGQLGSAYLGFMVIRPTDLHRVGRTVLRPAITDPDRQFIHCRAKFSAHIYGEELTVDGMPFTQQDSQVGVCAQASLWMLGRYMSRRFGYREFLPAEINRFAKIHMAMGRLLPAGRGLNLAQILDALEGMTLPALSYSLLTVDNCSPHIAKAFQVDQNASEAEQAKLVRKQRVAKLADIAYRYIESGLPVIFCTSNHALVGIGHTYEPDANASVAIQRIPAFIANNDNTGPYVEIPLFSPSDDHLSFSEVEVVVVVLPREVTLQGEAAEVMATGRVEALLAQRVLPQPITVAQLTSQLRPDLAPCLAKLEYRTFLRPSVDFQADIRRDVAAKRFDQTVGSKLLRLDYPKFVWITEISSSILLNKPKSQDRQCLGRVVIDSTAPARSRGEIIIHFADFLQINDRQANSPSPFELYPGSTPFAHKVLA